MEADPETGTAEQERPGDPEEWRPDEEPPDTDERHWLLETATQAALAGTTAHVPASRTKTYGTPSGPTPPPARHRAMRGRARKERARRGLLGRALATQAPRHAKAARERAAVDAGGTTISQPSGITARGCAAVIARGVAPVRATGAGPPPEPPRPVATAVPVRRRRIPVGPIALIILLVGVFATGIGLQHVTGSGSPSFLSGDYRQPPRKSPAMPASRPAAISIPDLQLRAAVHSVGLAPDGTIEVPPLERHREAGWFERSPTPGELGPSLIVGHVDSRTGPSVFHGLKTLKSGAKIEIARQDGSQAVFKVESVERFDKRALPNDRVYGDFSRANLRLITCGGQWVGGETGYADNVIVFASLASNSRRR
ncbi:class F sortase [Micromonospora sp. NPDC049679]|uniref:class F sortase n=1 Tax=Micromonospora sp. NPDC049679 TaxID=3155920 RepID=UPI00340665FB